MLAGRARRKKSRDQRAGPGGGSFRPPHSDDNNGDYDPDDPDSKPPLQNPPMRRRSSHLEDTSTKEKLTENDEALKAELHRLEASDDEQFKHPIGFSWLAALRILNAPADPVLNNTGYWIQPEDLDDIPAMFDSYLNVNCLYYSLVGVLAIETSLWLPIPPPDAPVYAQWLITVSRFCWAANGVWSMSAVVASFHILWSVYSTPTWAKRRFVFENSRTISIVYALGAPNFAMMLIGTITGVIGNVVSQYGFVMKDWVSAALGLGLGTCVTVVFVLCSGRLLSRVVRPWKIADENLRTQKRRWSETGRAQDDFYDNHRRASMEGSQIFDVADVDDIENAGFGPMEMPVVAQKLCAEGLTLQLLRKVNNEVLLDQLLQGAGVTQAGDRLRVILFVRDGPAATAMSVRHLGSGSLPEDVLDRSDPRLQIRNSSEGTRRQADIEFERVLNSHSHRG